MQLLDDMRRGGMPDSVEDFPSLETHRLQLQEDDPEGINAGVQAIFRLVTPLVHIFFLMLSLSLCVCVRVCLCVCVFMCACVRVFVCVWV